MGRRYICLDEADRMVDGGFEEEMRDVLSYFKVGCRPSSQARSGRRQFACRLGRACVQG